MTIEEIEAEIRGIYTWFAGEAPGVAVQEEGRLAGLWALADRYYLADAMGMTDAEIVSEYGYMTLLEREMHNG